MGALIWKKNLIFNTLFIQVSYVYIDYIVLTLNHLMHPFRWKSLHRTPALTTPPATPVLEQRTPTVDGVLWRQSTLGLGLGLGLGLPLWMVYYGSKVR